MPKRYSTKRPDDAGESEVARLADQFKLRIDVAMRSVKDMVEAGVDLWVVINQQQASVETKFENVKEPPANPAPKVMTSPQAAEYLGINPQTLALWRCTGRYPLPFVKVGRRVVYHKADLDKFIHDRTFNRGTTR